MSEEYDRAKSNFERDFPYKYVCDVCGDICRSRALTDQAVCPKCGEHMTRSQDRPTIIVAISDLF
jgi:rubrerythrin